MGLLIPEMKDTSMERLGQPLSKVIDQLNGQLDPSTWHSHVQSPDQSFRTGSPGEAPEKPPFCDFSEGLPAPMDFYRFTVESPSALTAGGSNHDPAGPGQPLHVPGSPASAGQEEGGGGGEAPTPGPLEDAPPREAPEPGTQEPDAKPPLVGEGPEPEPEPGTHETLCQLKRDQPSPCLSSAEDSGVDEGQGSPSDMSHSAEFRCAGLSCRWPEGRSHPQKPRTGVSVLQSVAPRRPSLGWEAGWGVGPHTVWLPAHPSACLCVTVCRGTSRPCPCPRLTPLRLSLSQSGQQSLASADDPRVSRKRGAALQGQSREFQGEWDSAGPGWGSRWELGRPDPPLSRPRR